MTKRRIHIENLQIKLPRAMRGDARGLAAGIGNQIMESIAGEIGAEIGGQRRSIRIDEISTEKIKRGSGTNEIGRLAASSIAAKVKAGIKKDSK